MKSFTTLVLDELRKLIVIADYLIWLLFDPSKFKRIDKSKIRKVLIIHLGAMGELLILTPVIHALKKELNTDIDFMVSKGKEDVLKNNPNLSKIIIYQDSYSKNLDTIKKENYNLAVIMWPGFPKISWMCMKAGIPYRIGVFKNVKDGINFFFTRRMLDLRRKHAVECNLDIIRTIGIDNKNPKLEFYLSKEDEQRGKKIISKLKLSKYVIIHPGFSFSNIKYPSRWWPPERYAAVADYLIKKRKMKVLLTGNNEEKKFSEDIKKFAKHKKDILITNGRLSLSELAYLIKKAGLIIAPSTGVIHLASALGTNIIQISGKDDQVLWTPFSKSAKVIFHPEVCTECDKVYCRKRTQECMKAITSEEVIKAIDSLLDRR
ncbi:MAG: glycosyltransferase family 9 protein [Candidatus Pacearchaeota archaeon]